MSRLITRLTGDPLADFTARDFLVGQKVLTAQGTGTARGIDESGALILERADGSRVRVMAGSVDFT